MKFSLGVAAALAGFASAAQVEPANVYIMSQSPDSTAELGSTVAHLIFLQRLASGADAGSLKDCPEDALDSAIRSINAFGKQPQALFQNAAQEPSQLLIMIEGVTVDNRKALDKALTKVNPAFQVKDTPRSAAHQSFVKDLSSVGVAQTTCNLERAMNPLETECWSGKSSVALYDLQKDPKIAQTLADNIARLVKLAATGEMDTTLVLVPESTRTSQIASWPAVARLARRQEEVMSEVDDATPTPPSTSSPKTGPFVVSAKDAAIPACFASKSSCETTTGNCSGHGVCQNKYPKAGEGKECFHCQCLKTEKGLFWAGAKCSKQDVSTPFWLFAGVTLLLLGIISFAITLLFNVGEEPLPGVIGAGVSRSK